MKQYFVGVDLGSANVVMVVGSREEGQQSINIEGTSIQNNKRSIKQGRICTALSSAVPNLSSAIINAKEELEDELGIKIEQAYFGLGDSNTRCVIVEDMLAVRNKRTGVIGNEEIVLLRQLISQIKPESPAEGVWERSPLCYFVNGTKQIIDPTGLQGSWLKARYMLTVGTNDQHNCLKHLHHRVGMEMQKIFVTPTITYPLFVSPQEAMEGVVIVDLGHEVTDVTIVRDNRVQYFRSLPVGAELIDADLKSILPKNSDISKIKHCYGRAISSDIPENEVIKDGNKEIIRRNIATVIEARLMDIAELVGKVVRESGFAEFIPHGYVLTGGTSSLELIEELFERELNRPCRKVETLHGINIKNNSDILITPVEHAAVAIMLHAATFSASYVKELDIVESKPKKEATPADVKPAQPTPRPVAPVSKVVPKPATPAPAPAPVKEEPKTEPTTPTEEQEAPETPQTTNGNMFGKFFRYISRQMGSDDKAK
ncbi:MAG: hypothetical protein IJX65_01260 [Alistipes sp.]|nr:hypothetical protein [Alistipes sp.]